MVARADEFHGAVRAERGAARNLVGDRLVVDRLEAPVGPGASGQDRLAVGGSQPQRSGGQDRRRHEVYRVSLGRVDLTAPRVDRERAALATCWLRTGAPAALRTAASASPLKTITSRFAVIGDVQSELGPEVHHGRTRGGDDEPLRAARYACSQLTPAAMDPVDRQEFEVRRPFHRERHAAEQAQSHPTRAEDETTGRKQVAFRWPLAFTRLPLDAGELDHDGESAREPQRRGVTREGGPGDTRLPGAARRPLPRDQAGQQEHHGHS